MDEGKIDPKLTSLVLAIIKYSDVPLYTDEFRFAVGFKCHEQ